MGIQMLGIDHMRAPLDVRADFSCTKKNMVNALEAIKSRPDVKGCVILSTCNRFEIWVNHNAEQPLPLYRYFCEWRDREQADPEEEQKYFVTRIDEDAIQHLFYLTCGLKSQIFAEDQILTQVKDAIAFSRENYCSDGVLEVLFRMAVTAAKKIKSEVVFSHGNPSVIHRALQILEKNGYSVKDKICMVIGNGEMGKVAASTLKEAGADVTVTVRQYRSGEVQIPSGCKRIHYGERMEYLPECDLVVSATASPNYTLRKELFEGITWKEGLILIDFAVPRDIETSIADLDSITLYDMDSFSSDSNVETQEEQWNAAGVIIADQMKEFYSWFSERDLIPRIMKIREDAAHDFRLRIEKELQRKMKEPQMKEDLAAEMEKAAGNVINKLLFGLKDALDDCGFLECIEGLEKLYEN